VTEEIKTTRKKKEPLVQKDLLGTELKLGDTVAFARQNQLIVSKVTTISPKTIKVKPLAKSGYGWMPEAGYQIYSDASIKLDGPDAVAYVLRMSK